MEVKMCANGHCYDGAKYASCPYCAGGAQSGGIGETVNVGGSAGIGETVNVGGSAGIGETVGVNGASYVPPAGGIGETVPAGSGWGGGQGGVTIPVAPGYTNDDYGSFEHTQIGGDETGSVVTAPVVGWLVCIDGLVKGCDFRIHAGYNYIGREVGDIHISGDMQISRQKDAVISYDNLDNSYFFGPSDGRNILRVNGKAIHGAVEIQAYDVLTIGTCKMMFVPLCGPHFDWGKGVVKDDA